MKYCIFSSTHWWKLVLPKVWLPNLILSKTLSKCEISDSNRKNKFKKMEVSKMATPI